MKVVNIVDEGSTICPTGRDWSNVVQRFVGTLSQHSDLDALCLSFNATFLECGAYLRYRCKVDALDIAPSTPPHHLCTPLNESIVLQNT